METATLLDAARRGDEGAFAQLVESHRRELHAHCYRMLGSGHDADDALQEALLRAWRGLGRFEGRSSLRSWLYTVATRTCLDAVSSRARRALPVDLGRRVCRRHLDAHVFHVHTSRRPTMKRFGGGLSLACSLLLAPALAG